MSYRRGQAHPKAKLIVLRFTEFDAAVLRNSVDKTMRGDPVDATEWVALSNTLDDALERPGGKLSEADKNLMRYLHRVEGLGRKALAKKFNCSPSTARNIIEGSKDT